MKLNSNVTHTLITVVCHKGKNIASGHYVTYVKHPNGFVCIDDNSVSRVYTVHEMLQKTRGGVGCEHVAYGLVYSVLDAD